MADAPASFDNVPEIDFTPTSRIPKMGKGTFVRYRPDHKSFGRFIKSEQMRDVTAEVAEDIAARAGMLAPRRKDRGVVPDGTAMADSFEVNREAGRLKVAGNVRVMVHVVNHKRSAAPMEFGNEHVKGHRMLGRAGAEFGDMHTNVSVNEMGE